MCAESHRLRAIPRCPRSHRACSKGLKPWRLPARPADIHDLNPTPTKRGADEVVRLADDDSRRRVEEDGRDLGRLRQWRDGKCLRCRHDPATYCTLSFNELLRQRFRALRVDPRVVTIDPLDADVRRRLSVLGHIGFHALAERQTERT